MAPKKNETILAQIVARFVAQQKKLDITDKSLTDAAQISIPVWRTLRNGSREGVQLSTLERLAVALHLEMEIDFTELEITA